MIRHKGLVIYPHELSDYWVDRFLSTGLNLLGLHPVAFKTNGHETVDETIEWLKKSESRRLLDRLAGKGIDIEYEVHALSWLLPRGLFSRRPEWFRMDENGNRTADYHFCHSNAEALECISERAKKLAGILTPTTGRYHFWLDDGFTFECHCPRCKDSDYSKSDTAMTVYNAILAGVRAFDPKAKQCYLAYYPTAKAPQKVKPDNGIFLEYAPMDRDQFLVLRNPASDKNKRTLGEIDNLLKVFTTKNAKVLDYWLDNSWYSGWKKPVKKFPFQADSAADDVSFYAEKGFETITCFACYLGEEYYLLHNEEVDLRGYAESFSKYPVT